MKRPFANKRPLGPFNQLVDNKTDIFVSVLSDELPGFGEPEDEAEVYELDESATIEARINNETALSSRDAKIDVANEIFMGAISMRVNDSDIFGRTVVRIEEIVNEELGIDNAKAIASCDATPSGRFR